MNYAVVKFDFCDRELGISRFSSRKESLLDCPEKDENVAYGKGHVSINGFWAALQWLFSGRSGTLIRSVLPKLVAFVYWSDKIVWFGVFITTSGNPDETIRVSFICRHWSRPRRFWDFPEIRSYPLLGKGRQKLAGVSKTVKVRNLVILYSYGHYYQPHAHDGWKGGHIDISHLGHSGGADLTDAAAFAYDV